MAVLYGTYYGHRATLEIDAAVVRFHGRGFARDYATHELSHLSVDQDRRYAAAFSLFSVLVAILVTLDGASAFDVWPLFVVTGWAVVTTLRQRWLVVGLNSPETRFRMLLDKRSLADANALVADRGRLPPAEAQALAR